ncbi:MAG: glucose-6-phosphate dehydrogenase [Cyanobacteria bacterium P01_C01_bin.120]
MTAFQTTDIPASVNTVEKLAVWATTVLNHLYPTVTAIEATGLAERVAQAGPFEVTAVDPPQWRNIARTSVPLNKNWQRGASKIWTHAEDLGSSSIPTEFKS